MYGWLISLNCNGCMLYLYLVVFLHNVLESNVKVISHNFLSHKHPLVLT
jgi:hypothetical protein